MLFQYAQLAQDSIRLVEFHPSSTPSDIHLTLSHQSRYFDESSHYIAIWYPSEGPDMERKTITLNGRTRTVPSTAWDALSAISEHRDRGHKYWIDAVCINQVDEAEKRMHSQQMDRIYSSAEEVYVWLGPSNESLRRAFAAVKENEPNSEEDPAVRDLANRKDARQAISEVNPETAVFLSGELECPWSLCQRYRESHPQNVRQKGHGSL